MRPSTRVKIGIVAAIPLAMLAMHYLLPRLSRWMSGAYTGSEAFETAHFEIYAPAADVAKSAGEVAEGFATEFAGRWGDARGIRLPEDRLLVYIFADHAALAKHGLLKQGQALERNAGYFSAGERLIALVGADPEGLRHELTHMFVALSWPGAELSPWLNEGMAQWHETGAAGSFPASVARDVAAAMAGGSALPLAELLDAEPSDFTGEKNRRFYFEAAALYAWLAERKPAALEKYLAEERAPGPVRPGALERATQLDAGAIEFEWREFVADKAR
ncbi:MAG: hypothetical protein HYY18_05070 [Planctomycetes bacterium]|nr:hypothetical protein [Planctomycetota bacterium]